MNKIISFIFGLLLLAPITGELWRLPVFGFELLPSDIIIPIFFLIWGIDKIQNDRKIRLGKIGKAIILFVFTVTLVYFLNFFRFDTGEMIVAGIYMCRFFMYVILALMTFDLLNRDKTKETFHLILMGMGVSTAVIAILGFLQLQFFPSFLKIGMQLKGWDPHIGRLLSTWFDPNYVGGFLAFMLGIFIALALYFRYAGKKKHMVWMGVVVFIAIIAVYLTYSRSAYLALIATLGILAFLKSRKLLIVTVLIVVLGFSLSPRVQERTLNAVDSGKALFGLDSQKPLDPTAKLRVNSWEYAVNIISDYPILGAGYGRYRYEIVKRGYGLPGNHASGGSDSSLLSIWAMTGIFGMLTYLGIYFMAIIANMKEIWKEKTLKSYLKAGIIASLGGLFIHSIFVNSLLFPLIMVYLWVGIGMLDFKKR